MGDDRWEMADGRWQMEMVVGIYLGLLLLDWIIHVCERAWRVSGA